jgi:hypothetical protein
MKLRPMLLVSPPIVRELPDGRHLAFSVRFPDLWAIERDEDAAAFVVRLLIQKRLYGQAWRWETPSQASTGVLTDTGSAAAT